MAERGAPQRDAKEPATTSPAPAWQPVPEPPPPGYGYVHPPPPPPGPSAPVFDEKTWAMFCHLASFFSLVAPFGNIVGPLLVWLLKRKESSFVDHHGKEALNFQISVTLLGLVVGVAALLALSSQLRWDFRDLDRLFIGLWPLVAAMAIIELLGFVFTVIAAMKATNGAPYTYPFRFPLVR